MPSNVNIICLFIYIYIYIYTGILEILYRNLKNKTFKMLGKPYR